jgi:microcystin-dependent protein
MATNEILPFASTNTGTNLLTQSEYASDAQRTTGHQPGIARAKLENKALRQASTMAAGLAEFIADWQANNVTDGLTPQQVADYLLAALSAAFPQATETVQGKIELATIAEAIAGTDAQRAITPATMWAAFPYVLPAGSIIYVAQNSAPNGFLKANGATISRSTYSSLFAAIGTTFGSGNGSTTFQIPDLRGEFPRGWDDGRGVDNGRAFGSSQDGSFTWVGSNTDNNGFPMVFDPNTGTMTLGFTSTTVTFPNNFDEVVTQGISTYGAYNWYNVGESGTFQRAKVRPRNVALLACIKF